MEYFRYNIQKCKITFGALQFILLASSQEENSTDLLWTDNEILSDLEAEKEKF